MPDWLQKTFESDVHVSVGTLIARQLLALVFGCVVGLVYHLAQRGGSSAMGGPRQRAEMLATLVLLTVLISMMTGVIGDNIARAFAIVGALSIVRFRTVIEDTRDTAFVILAVAVGMAVGAGHLVLPLVTMPIAAAAAMAFQPRTAAFGAVARGGGTGGGAGGLEHALRFRLTVRIGTGAAGDAAVRQTVQAHALSSSISSIESARQGAALETTLDVHLRNEDEAQALVTLINRIEGVQNVELRRM